MALAKEVREAVYARLADSQTGLNPRFMALCQEANVEPPMPGSNQSADGPWNFDPEQTANVYQANYGSINVIEGNSELQYPCLFLYTTTARQAPLGQRVMMAQFTGIYTLELRFYFCWLTSQTPTDGNYEIFLDLLQRALVETMHADVTAAPVEGEVNYWFGQDIIYAGDLNEVVREPLTLVKERGNEAERWRCGTRYQMTFRSIE